jgi:hypothetical protein
MSDRPIDDDKMPAEIDFSKGVRGLHHIPDGARVFLPASMDILKMLTEFRAERLRIEEAILALERLAGGLRGKPRGRPPKWVSVSSAEAGSAPRKKRTVSAAARKRMAAAQKKRWAARKAQRKPFAS